MAITLRETAIDTSGKATELSYQEMNNNLKSFYYSSSLNGGTLDLHFLSGSTSHSISVPSIYTADSDLAGNRVVTAAGSDLTFDMSTANFILNTDPGQRVTISNLASANTPQVVGIDSTGTLKLMNTSSISGGVSDNIYTANGTISSNRTVTFNNSSLSLTGSLSSMQVHTNEVLFPLIPDAGGVSIEVVAIASNGRLFKTGSSALGGGGATSPGGSDGQVQYNNGGVFGGESTFTYDDTNNVLSIQGVANGPAIKLLNATPGFSDGAEFAELVARSSIYSADVANIVFKGDGASGGGDYPTRIEFGTTPDGQTAPTTKFQIKNDGKLIADQYGSGTFTGTATKYLAVDSSGNIIEENVPSGGGSPAGSDTQVQFNDGGSFGGDAGMTYNKTSDTLVVAGTVSGSNLIAEDEVYVKGMATVNQPVVGNSRPVVINTASGQLKQSIENPLVGNIEKARVAGTLTINETSNPVMNEINGGRILCFPTASNCRLKFGFPAGDEGPTSWEKDFRTTVYNIGCDTTDVADQNYDLEIEIVAPNDGGSVFKSYFIGENSAGTSQFEYDTVSPNTGVVYTTVVKSQGMVDIMMDYENRTIVVWGKSVT